MAPISDRPTAELIVIYLAGIVGIVLVIAETGIFLLAIFNPEVDVGPIVSSVSETTSVVLGAVVGYIAGRSTRGSKNGTQDTD